MVHALPPTERPGRAIPGTGALMRLIEQRERLAVLPTPLHRADRLCHALGREVWIKRDDLTGVGLGGNKIRKMELLAADARRAGADTLVGVGAPQSNHARTVAAVAAMLDMRCHLVLGGSRPARSTGNLLLDELYGAELHFAGGEDWSLLAQVADEVAAGLRAHGARPYPIPVGGSVALGAVAFVAAWFELRDQLGAAGVRPTTVLHASSSGGTQAGLTLGAALAGDDLDVVGVEVAKIADPLAGHVGDLMAAAADLLGVERPDRAPRVLTGYLGPGYAQPSAASERALVTLARSEGIVADPVYTAKALAALVAEPWPGPVVFWHTGGAPALFADGAGTAAPFTTGP